MNRKIYCVHDWKSQHAKDSNSPQTKTLINIFERSFCRYIQVYSKIYMKKEVN